MPSVRAVAGSSAGQEVIGGAGRSRWSLAGNLELVCQLQEEMDLGWKALMVSTSSSLAVLSEERRKRVYSVAATIILY